MTDSAGLSEYALNGMLNTLCRADALVVSGWFGQMHLEDPGLGGLLNPSTDTDRVQVLFSAADNAMITSTGEPAGWPSTTAQIIKYISFHDGMDPGTSTWIGNGRLGKPAELANGDVFQLAGGVLIEFTQGLAVVA